MKSRYFIHLIILMLLLFFLWLLDVAQQQRLPARINTNLTIKTVDRITVRHSDKIDIKLLKTDANWSIIEPIQARANETRLNLLLSLLEQTMNQQFPVSPQIQLEAFGLANPKVQLMLNDHVFSFGDEESLSGQRYLHYRNSIYVFEDDISPLLMANATGFIDNRLFTAQQQITALQLPFRSEDALSHNEFLQLQLENDQWESQTTSFTEAQLMTLVQSWQQAYAMQVIPVTDINMAQFIEFKIKIADGSEKLLFARLQANGLSLINPQTQLQYQFPATVAHTLFPYKKAR